MSTNTIIFTGNPTAAPQLSETRSGKSVTDFTLVSNRRVKVDDEWTDAEALFQEVTVWNDLAKHTVANVTTKRLVTVIGHLEPQSYEVDGQKRYKTILVAERVCLDLQWGLK
jgi:single-strand DNA-binding protein